MNHSRILIIGAGASGISAAAKLLEHGFTNFRILEAENRIGGRINTTLISGFPIELGAEWIHGENGNVIYELASKYGLVNNDVTDVGSFLNTSFYDSSGSLINKDISVALTAVYYDIMNAVKKNLSSEVLKGSVGTYFEVEFQKAVDEIRKGLNVDTGLCEKFLKTFENWENSIDASDSWHETSLSGHLEYWECDGNSLTTWKNHGYETIFSLLLKKIPNPEKELPVTERIIFNREVIKVHWNKECESYLPNVKAECLDGSVYTADNLLVTCSLGVLKERASKMFSPPLPVEKLKCIENLGFGTVDKIFVKFKTQWWKDDINGYGFLWSEEEIKNDSSGWLSGVICFHPVNSKWPLLRGWVTGKAARVMESLSNDDVVNGINYLFNKFLGSSLEVPSVEICVMSKWYENPHFRGSYSCRLMKSEMSNVWASQLAEAVCDVKEKPILFFGGEATHDHYFSTVHGAVEAGQREAFKLLQSVMESSRTSKHAQVAIVGAGISGLAAAKTLLENGVSDIIILEAQSKPGGRICSIQIEDFVLELGAQWIHGEKNEVFKFCQDNNLLTDELSSEGEGIYLRENGEQIDETLVKEVDDVIRDILENCENYVSSTEKVFRSIGEELSLKFDYYLASCSEDSENLKKIKKELLNWHIRFQLIDNSCSDLFNLSSKAWGLFKFCGGNDYVNFKSGYTSLVNAMVNCIPENVLHCDTAVRKIDWLEEIYMTKQNPPCFSSESNYSVKITTGDDDIINCQYVIITSSLGYLKKNYKTMFCPSLPNYLSEVCTNCDVGRSFEAVNPVGAYLGCAIEYLDFGVIDKIFLIYEKPWWDPKIKGFQLLWSTEVSEEAKQHWSRSVTGFDVIMKNKPVLLGWVGGAGAKIVEEMPEGEVGREATEILRRFTNNPDIPFPKKVIRTKWWCNEFVCGAYSHITVKCDESNICGSNLAQPVYSTVRTETGKYKKPTILLAGESTHKNHFSTVHGAYESGQSQARVILNHLQSWNAGF